MHQYIILDFYPISYFDCDIVICVLIYFYSLVRRAFGHMVWHHDKLSYDMIQRSEVFQVAFLLWLWT